MRLAHLALLPAGLAAAALISGPARADLVDQGRALHEEHCVECHVAKHDDQFYLSRVGKKFPTKQSLATQVQACANNFNLPWFEEEVNAVTEYLNQTYYKYK